MRALSQRLEAVEQREGQYAESVNSQGREVVALQQQLAKYLEPHAGVEESGYGCGKWIEAMKLCEGGREQMFASLSKLAYVKESMEGPPRFKKIFKSELKAVSVTPGHY